MNTIQQIIPGTGNSIIVDNVYGKVTNWTNTIIDNLFALGDNAFTELATLMTLCATIYVAGMGYAMLTGRISVSPQNAVISISKLLIAIMLFATYAQVAGFFYEIFFTVPEAIANALATQLNSAVGTDTYVINTLAQGLGSGGGAIAGNVGDLDSVITSHSVVVGVFTAIYIEVNEASAVGAGLIWFIGMSPVILTVAILTVARFMTALLLFILPVIAIASLFGRGLSFWGTWFKVMCTLGLTVILTYVAFSILIVLMTDAIVNTALEAGVATLISGALGGDLILFTLYDLAPLGVMALIVFIIISQIPSIAGGIVGAAGINTQQVSGFLNIAALRAA